MKMLRFTKWLPALAAALVVAACGGGDDADDLADRLANAPPKVRLVHAGVFTGPLTLTRNGTAQPGVANVAYANASNYVDVPDGSAEWRVATASDARVGSTTLAPQRGTRYMFVAVPDFSLFGTQAELLLITDPYDWGLTTASARVRVLHAAANSQAPVDVYLTLNSTDIGSRSPHFANVGYKTANPASGSNSLDFAVGAGSHTLTIAPAGSTSPIFQAPVSLANNADWLITLLPDSIAPNDLRVLVVKSDDSGATQEIANML
ncbi:MAG TPA: DUF4397 domain-containing protein [Rhizobacter sp.]